MTTPTITPTRPAPTAPTRPKLVVESTSHLTGDTATILYQGLADTGKTHCAFSFPSPFGIYFDSNMRTLRKHPNVPFVVPRTWDAVERDLLPAIKNRRLTELVREIEGEGGELPYANYTVRTIVLDSLTFFCNMNILELGKGGTLEMENLQWDTYYARLHRLVRECCDAAKPMPGRESYFVVMTVHEATKANKKGEVIDLGPSVQGRMYAQLTTYFDAVLLTDATRELVSPGVDGEGKPLPPRPTKRRYAWTIDQGMRKAKNQIGPIDEQVVPTWDVLSKAWGWS